MHRRFKIILFSCIFITILIISAYLWLYSTSPDYHGTKQIQNLTGNVEVVFDESGIPHIKTENTLDAFRTLGYLHATERQFQMELLRRAGSGKLSELLGKDLLQADIMFHTLGLPVYAQKSAENFISSGNPQIKAEVEAYLDGINQSLQKEHRCPEFMLLGYHPEPYTMTDLYNIAGYMAFSFALGQRTDPLVNWISDNLGAEYLENMGLETYPAEKVNEWEPQAIVIDSTSWKISQNMQLLQQLLPFPGFEASNSWAVSGKKTKNGFPILCNDTHIRHAVPNTWFEAVIISEDLKIYGHYLPGIPYCLIGHSEHHAWGITMLEHDDIDFYSEKIDSDGKLYEWGDTLLTLEIAEANIKIKDKTDTLISWKNSHHGPIINQVFAPDTDTPVSLWWDYTKSENQLMQSFRNLALAADLGAFSSSLSQIHSPGINVIYADKSNNIAWWAVGKLLKRPSHVNSFRFIDGSLTENDPLGYYNFSDNPHLINPARGFVYSANEQPGLMGDSTWYPGYYVVAHRSFRIHEMLEVRKNWTHRSMKEMMSDATPPLDACIVHDLSEILLEQDQERPKEQTKILKLLENWDGSHELKETAPVIYYKWLYHLFSESMQDELGADRFKTFLSTHWKYRSLRPLMDHVDSPWWDNVQTEEKENREQIVELAFTRAIKELKDQLGEDYEEWQWSSVRHIEIEHPLSKVPLLGMVFNVGPEKIKGAGETIGASGFSLESDGFYEVSGGSQMRIVHDLSHPDSSWNILPLGQSGHPFSEHYNDQFDDYCEFDFELRNFYMTDDKQVNSALIFEPAP